MWYFLYMLFDIFTFSRNSTESTPLLIMLSRTRSAICSKLAASISSMTVPFKRRLLNSKSECSDSVATWGLLHLLPPSSTSSSNLIHLCKMYNVRSFNIVFIIKIIFFYFFLLNYLFKSLTLFCIFCIHILLRYTCIAYVRRTELDILFSW